MALGTVRFRTPPSSTVAPGLRLTPVGDYVMWALAGPHARFPVPDSALGDLDAAGLHRIVEGMVRQWHPRLRGLVARADVEATFLVRVRASVPVPAWQPSRVTVLGDAIHAMSPARGSGANLALRDAQRLSDTLTSLTAGDELVDAVGRYEAGLREEGYAAVEASRRAEEETGTRRNRLAFWLYRRLAR
jgi:2-polyprenyl-6-methoxyphenol hydroxylase-like FAD-dependent oxidoreductase